MGYFLSFFCRFLIQVYRVFFSIYFGGACRFHPSCSCFARDVFLSHPPGRAFVLVLGRLAKCHCFGPFGVDPAPLPCSEETSVQRSCSFS